MRASRTLDLIVTVLLLAVSPAAAADRPGGGWLGAFLDDAVDGGVQLVAVIPDSPASRADLRPGDIVLAADGRRLLGAGELGRVLDGTPSGTAVRLQLLRGGTAFERVVELSPRRTVWTVLPPQAPRAPALLAVTRAGGLHVETLTPELRRHLGSPEDRGVLVTRVAASPDPGGGVRVGDVIVELGGRAIRQAGDVERQLVSTPDPTPLPATIVRGGEVVTVKIAVRPEPAAAAVSPGTVEAAIRNEIERLESRIQALRQQLDRVD